MATIGHYRQAIAEMFFCLQCKELEFAPPSPPCFKCGNLLVPLEAKIDRDTARIRARIMKYGVGKTTAATERTQRLSLKETNLALYLTAQERA